jgi:hypothetical protein
LEAADNIFKLLERKNNINKESEDGNEIVRQYGENLLQVTLLLL